MSEPLPFVFVHQLLFDEIAESRKPVITITGEMVGGPDRRSGNAVHQVELWKIWQRNIQAAERIVGAIPPHVMESFQDTKHLSRPPQEGDKGLHTKAPLIIPAIQAGKSKPFHFATSFTGMEEFLTCPFKWAANKFYKTVPYVESEAVKWGNRVHKAAENYLLNNLHGGKLEVEAECLPLVKRYCDLFLASGAQLFVEQEICFGDGKVLCGWKDWDTVRFRFKGDLFILKDRRLTYVDYKTGKVKENLFQIEVAFALADLFFGDRFDTFNGSLIHVKETDPQKAIVKLPQPLDKSALPAIWKKIDDTMLRMQQACDAENFRQSKNGHCRSYCEAVQCPHCGKR